MPMPIKRKNPIAMKAAKKAAARERSWKIEDGVWEEYVQAKRNQKYKKNEYHWIEGKVDIDKEHIGIWYRNLRNPVAFVVPGKNKSFIVQFQISPSESTRSKRILYDVYRELDFVMREIGSGESDLWKYIKYVYCRSTVNLIGSIHWILIKEKQGFKVICESCDKEITETERLYTPHFKWHCKGCDTQFVIADDQLEECPLCGSGKIAQRGRFGEKKTDVLPDICDACKEKKRKRKTSKPSGPTRKDSTSKRKAVKK